MSEFKVELPDVFVFHHILPVRINDINYGNHLDFSILAGMLHNIRALLLYNNQLTEGDLDGSSLITKSMVVDYKRPAIFNDKLDFYLGKGKNNSPTKFETIYLVKNKIDDKEIARASITLAFINNITKKPTKTPSILEELFDKSL